MIFYYVMTSFYPNISEANEYEEVLIPYSTFEEAAAAVENIMELYEQYNEDDEYDSFWVPDTKTTIGFITIRDNKVTRAFRFEIMESSLGPTKIG